MTSLKGLWRRFRRQKAVKRLRSAAVDLSLLTIPIETASGEGVSLADVSDWGEVVTPERRLRRGASKVPPVTIGELLDEEHHRVYRRPWLTGRFRFDFVRAHGLEPHHRLLDIGCGAGRLGVWAIQYLNPGRYFGVDCHLRSLIAFSAYEVRLFDLAGKQPRLLLDCDFRFSSFGVPFDFVIDSTVLSKLSRERFRSAARSLQETLSPRAMLLTRKLQPFMREDLEELGFVFETTVPVCDPIVVYPRRGAVDEEWHVLRSQRSS